MGLLKQSDVGVALLSDDAARLLKESQEKAAEKRRAAIAGGPAAVKQYMQNTMQAKQSQLEKLKAVHAATGAQQNTPAERRAALQRQLAEQMSKLESELAEEEVSTQTSFLRVHAPLAFALLLIPFFSDGSV